MKIYMVNVDTLVSTQIHEGFQPEGSSVQAGGVFAYDSRDEGILSSKRS